MSRYNNYYSNDYQSSGDNESYSPRTKYGNRYNDSSEAEEERTRERRPGGYGGFEPRSRGYGGAESSPARPGWQAARVNRPTSLERSTAKRRSGGYGSSRSRSRPDNGRNGEGSRRIEEVLSTIQSDWPFMMDSQCVPVQVALQLMDPSSLGLAQRLEEFRDVHDQLQSSLKAIVNEHHQGFNSSIGTFHKIQNSIQTSQSRVRTLRDSLVGAKVNLSTTKPELKGFATASQNYDEMLGVLSAIEQLQQVPEKLEARISEKRFLSAVDILQEAMRTMNRSEMENIGALGDLKVYLSNQEHSLTDILVEELHSHLYLKSPYCEDRWKAYAQNQPKPTNENSNVPKNVRGELLEFLDNLYSSSSSDLAEDAQNRNPEASTFHYIQLLLISLQRLGRLDSALTAIEQRLPVELFRVVDKCNHEVSTRHPSVLQSSLNNKNGSAHLILDVGGTKAALLKDLLSTLYARFEAIAEGHRVVDEVIRGIAKRQGFQAVSGFKELWKLYQSEIRSLLHDYLATDGDLSFRGGQNQGGGSVFQKVQRDKNKRMFKLANLDPKSDTYSSSISDLETILKASVPGLVSDSQRNSLTTSLNLTNVATTLDSGTGHKLLVEPSVFNMGILLPPSLEFLNRLKEIVPPASEVGTNTLTNFLDDFLVNVFLPQLDETVVDIASRAMIEDDSFIMDRDWTKEASKPVFKGTTKFFELITAVCRMLDDIPHDQAFSQVVISQMVAYYDRCCGWFKAMVARAQPKADTGRKFKSAASFAQEGELSELIKRIAEANGSAPHDFLEKETTLLLAQIKVDGMEEADILTDRKSIGALCLLCTSMKWLANKIAQLRYITSQTADSSQRTSSRQSPSRRWTLNLTMSPSQGAGNVYLPLNRDTAIAFDGVVASYQQLATTALLTLHLEFRCHAAAFLTRSMQGSWCFDQPLNEPDNEVLALNADLVAFDEEIDASLQKSQQAFIKHGLAFFIDALILQLTPNITSMNEHGRDRMSLNLLVLLQNLKNLEPAARLERSTLYYDLFAEGSDAIVKRAQSTSGQLAFDYEELKTLLELCFSETLKSDRRDLSMQAKRALDDRVLQLSEALWT